MAAQHGDRGRRTAVLGCVTDRHAVREPGETIPLSPGSHHYCVDGHANALMLVGVGQNANRNGRRRDSQRHHRATSSAHRP
jgi:hypothetical protein